MIQHVYERALESKADVVIVATDDQRIIDCVESFGGKAVMTKSDHPSGTDRIHEAIQGLDVDLVVNIQGDEPLMPAVVVDQLIDRMVATPEADMGTAAVKTLLSEIDEQDPNVVKVVTDIAGNALYFSRSLLPYPRNRKDDDTVLLHWGVYIYRRDLLDKFIQWPCGELETRESLEQLRVLENGVKIAVLETNLKSIGVDVPEDVKKVEEIINGSK
jgi:3-deoxy-manno-octulosonate cytidylyltransferase (CMP-KDO synthetase)